MKKTLKKILSSIVLILFMMMIVPVKALTPSTTGYYSYEDYVIDNYNIDIVINENNTFDITETITAYFNIPKHGIYRSIPLRNTIKRLDGTISKNRAKITNVSVSEKFTTSRSNGMYTLKIGSANQTLTGKKEYVIKYNYNIGKDPVKDYDELYYNIIGTEWDTVIGNITFKITMPKEFDANKLGFSSGNKGSTENGNIIYNVNGNVIEGSYNGILDAYESLTVRLELPEGYFVGAGFTIKPIDYLIFIIPIVFLIISILLWYKYGKDDQVIETVEFYPPEGFNSLEVGFLYRGKATNQDVTSLLVYLANKGYIKIVEKEEKSLFSRSNNFEIIKLKDYDGDNTNERIFLEGLFDKKFLPATLSAFGYINNRVQIENTTDDNLNKVTESDLKDSFYRTMRKILLNVNSRSNKKKIFETSTSFKSLMVILMIIISLLVIVLIPTVGYIDSEEIITTLILIAVYFPFYWVGITGTMPKISRLIMLGFIMFHSFAFFSTLTIIDIIIEEPFFLVGFILGIVCIIGMFICLAYLPKRTLYGNEMLGKIRGFKNFLETAEKSRLEAMVMENPTYFYDILPYTYVLGVSDKWIKKFETIALQSPDWYDSPSHFNVSSFGNFMNSTMSTAQTVMSSSPSSSSSGSSGGGSSGGGSGGGGGGSW